MTRDSDSPRRAAQWRLAAVALAWMLLDAAPGRAQQPGQMPPPAVVVERIEVRPVRDPVEFIARVEATEAVDVRARVQGVLQAVAFQAGQPVAAGDLLFEIEPDRYQAAVESARARVAQAQAARQEAQRTLARNEELAEQQQVSRAVLDEARAAFEIAQADVAAAQAQLRAAELDLSYTRISAPIPGEIGRALVTRGNVVGPESGPLARIVQLHPIRVVFSVAEGMVVTLRQEAAGGEVDTGSIRFSLRLPNDTTYEQPGELEYVASEVDPQTGTVAVRTIFPNPDRLLIPNQFVTLLAEDEAVEERPIVPQTAVLQDRQGRFVFVLRDDNSVTQRRIATGARVDNGWAVTEGLEGGEPVVVQGVQRLSEGARVQPAQGQPVGGGS